jgi:hypothetical protein
MDELKKNVHDSLAKNLAGDALDLMEKIWVGLNRS